ncbi:MAG: Gfo/Idh/MocA family oxidoreductase [Labilithrix sp.]|nr:Gfo/Idh/MocA family oxidoreductase [Labilithrix sp.]
MRVLVHGTGSIGMRHLTVLRSRLGVETLALPVREHRGDAVELREHATVRSYEDASLLGVTAAIIATDTGRHLSDAAAALQAGCNVLVEKPVSSHVRGLAGLASLAAQKQRLVFVAQNMRFLRSLIVARNELPRLGAIHSVRIECQSYLPDWRADRDFRRSYSARLEDGGVLRDLVHEIDYACWLFGQPTKIFAATKRGLLGIEAEEEADLLWLTRNTTVSLRLDYVTRIPRRCFHAEGENGALSWDGLANTVTLQLNGRPKDVSTHPMDRDEMMEAQARRFLAAVEGESPDGLATLDAGAFAVAVLDAARRSAADGTWVTVTDWRDA